MNEPDLARSLLQSAQTIAVVGYSARPDRPSNSVSAYLRRNGYRIIPVNPQLRGATIEGERAYDRLVDIRPAEQIDLIDVFRRGEFLDDVVDDALASGMSAIWFQLGLGNVDAARRAESMGMRVVWDRCTAIEHRQLRVER
ncbi:MAG TPA: CoA-binding protein [Chloroflexi bacterium]|jgi:predicted CoA-binding protein|nr:CoA-binding protein [Chloroflexota bacterium]HAL27027.1 CoA-binding protein [Chloroflexota bacterium]